MDTHTSQQQRREHQLAEGSGSSSVPAVQYGSEKTGAPGPVTQPVKGEILKIGIPTISQTEYQRPEGN